MSPEVTEALLERERLAKTLQDEEELARLRASSLFASNVENVEGSGTTGTLGETLEADARWGNELDEDHVNKTMRAAEAARHADLVRKLERKLYLVSISTMEYLWALKLTHCLLHTSIMCSGFILYRRNFSLTTLSNLKSSDNHNDFMPNIFFLPFCNLYECEGSLALSPN